MLRALGQLRQDLVARRWDDPKDEPHFVVHLREGEDGRVTGVYKAWTGHTPLMRTSLGAKAALFIRDMEDCATEDCIVGLVPSPKSKRTCTVKVRIGATSYTAADETWLLRVRPSDSVVPAYRNTTIVPRRTYMGTSCHLLDGDHPPRVLCALLSQEACRLVLAVFSPFEPLQEEILPDLRYRGPSNLASVIGRELAEVVWHPRRVFERDLRELDMLSHSENA